MSLITVYSNVTGMRVQGKGFFLIPEFIQDRTVCWWAAALCRAEMRLQVYVRLGEGQETVNHLYCWNIDKHAIGFKPHIQASAELLQSVPDASSLFIAGLLPPPHCPSSHRRLDILHAVSEQSHTGWSPVVWSLEQEDPHSSRPFLSLTTFCWDAGWHHHGNWITEFVVCAYSFTVTFSFVRNQN